MRFVNLRMSWIDYLLLQVSIVIRLTQQPLNIEIITQVTLNISLSFTDFSQKSFKIIFFFFRNFFLKLDKPLKFF